MVNTQTALARGFAAGVVVIHLLVGGYVFFRLGGFSESGLLAYLFTLSFALTGARGIWADRYKVATVGAVGMLVVATLQNVFVIGLATVLAVALVLGYFGQEQEQAQEQTEEEQTEEEQTEEQEQEQLEEQKETEEQEHEQLEEQTEEQEQKETEEQEQKETEEQEQKQPEG